MHLKWSAYAFGDFRCKKDRVAIQPADMISSGYPSTNVDSVLPELP